MHMFSLSRVSGSCGISMRMVSVLFYYTVKPNALKTSTITVMIFVCPVGDRDATPASCAHIMPHIALTPGKA